MLDFYQKRKLKVILASRIVQVLVVSVTLLVIWSAYTRRVEVEKEAQALQERKEALETEVQYLSDERGIEAEMRRQFDVAKDGEKVVVIVEDESDSVETIPIATSTNERRWYEFWH